MRLLAASFLLLAAPALAEPVHLAAHQATYTLSLVNGRDGDVAGVSGTMAYEVTDACDGGWT